MGLLPGQGIDRETLTLFPFGQTVDSSADAEPHEGGSSERELNKLIVKPKFSSSNVRAVRTHTPIGKVPRTSRIARTSKALSSELCFNIECGRPIPSVQPFGSRIIAAGHKHSDRKPPNSKWLCTILRLAARSARNCPNIFGLSIAMSRFSFNGCFGENDLNRNRRMPNHRFDAFG